MDSQERIKELDEQVMRMGEIITGVVKSKLNRPWQFRYYVRLMAKALIVRQDQTIKILKQKIRELEDVIKEHYA